MALNSAFKTAIGMSFISMIAMEAAMNMKDLMELYKKETDKRKKKKKLETQKYGRPKKKGELEASKGSFVKKKRISFTDYRVKGLFS